VCPSGVPDIRKKSDTVHFGEVDEGQGRGLGQGLNRMKEAEIEFRVGSGRLKERAGLCRRTGWAFGPNERGFW
jgi:hypothetical protein